jgi:hypothetical protein
MADFEEPNGLAFTGDGATLYVSDTSLSLGEVPGHKSGTKHEIIAFDLDDSGALSNRRFFCHTDHGYPDGFAVDARVGCGRARRTACISGQPIGASWASCQHPRSSRTATLGAQTDSVCSSQQLNICSRSTLSAKLMKMPVGIADQPIGI